MYLTHNEREGTDSAGFQTVKRLVHFTDYQSNIFFSGD